MDELRDAKSRPGGTRMRRRWTGDAARREGQDIEKRNGSRKPLDGPARVSGSAMICFFVPGPLPSPVFSVLLRPLFAFPMGSSHLRARASLSRDAPFCFSILAPKKRLSILVLWPILVPREFAIEYFSWQMFQLELLTHFDGGILILKWNQKTA